MLPLGCSQELRGHCLFLCSGYPISSDMSHTHSPPTQLTHRGHHYSHGLSWQSQPPPELLGSLQRKSLGSSVCVYLCETHRRAHVHVYKNTDTHTYIQAYTQTQTSMHTYNTHTYPHRGTHASPPFQGHLSSWENMDARGGTLTQF